MNAAAAFFAPWFFPQGNWLQVPLEQVRQVLRETFAQWGRPDTIRVDNGGPWGSNGGDLPPDLSLWLLGLGIQVHWNDPHTPQQNGVIERSQGTGKRWAEPGSCSSVEELQSHLEMMDEIQRDEYPSIRGQSRSAAFPELRHSGRDYNQEWEEHHWQHQLVLAHVATYVVRRKVDKNGDVWLYHRPRYAGVANVGKYLHVMLDPHRVEWLFTDDQGRQVRCQRAEEMGAERIKALTVSKRK